MSLETDFIDYWDDVIKQWIAYPAISGFTGSAKEQEKIFNSYNGCVKGNKYKLNPDYMPEPYWGDPRECSIVVINRIMLVRSA